MKEFKTFLLFHFILLLMIIVIFPNISLAQQQDRLAKKWTVKTGFGYYNPMTTTYKGNIFYGEIGYTLPTDFSIGIGFGLSDVFEEYSEVPLFDGFRSIHNYYHLKLYLDKEFILDQAGRHLFSAGTGITYIEIRYAEPTVYVNPIRNEMGEVIGSELLVGLNESSRSQDEAGLFLQADYSYILGNVGLGLHIETHLLYDVGLGGLVIAPQIIARF